MDGNTNKSRCCGRMGKEVDDELSMHDVLEEQARIEADASALLGASDPHNCTYPKGYLKRQALYSCATCTPNGNAGVCLACSFACHEGHDLFELYTKRFFCCDCGNDKFSGRGCKLVKDKLLNSRNRYNQNFRGLYCSCSRPYPDPEDKVDDEMIQCILCEDWYHGRHLKAPVPEEFSEMTCPECMSRQPFLWAYYVSIHYNMNKKEESLETSIPFDVEKSGCSSSPENKVKRSDNVQVEVPKKQKPSKTGQVPEDQFSSNSEEYNCATDVKLNNLCETMNISCDGRHCVKRPRDATGEIETFKSKFPRPLKDDSRKNVATNEENCVFQSLQKSGYDFFEHAAFWPQDWRCKLCRCHDCMEMYRDKGVEFLIDESDTVAAYEELGAEDEVQEEASVESLFAGMHRVQQIEIARGVQEFKTDLTQFLQGFAREGKVVTETDIREFFQSLDEKRRQKMNIPPDNYH